VASAEASAATPSSSQSSKDGAAASSSDGKVEPKESREVVLGRLMKLEPKELMKEIVSGHVPLSLLNQVAGRLPAEMLQEAVDFLSKLEDGTKETSATVQSCEYC